MFLFFFVENYRDFTALSACHQRVSFSRLFKGEPVRYELIGMDSPSDYLFNEFFHLPQRVYKEPYRRFSASRKPVLRAGTAYRVTSAAVVAYAASAYMINYDSVAFFESLESFALFDDVSAGFVPEVGESSPPMILRSVDLPQQFSPVISTSSAPSNSRSTLSRAFTQAFQLRYSLVIPLRLIFIFPLPFPFLSKRIKRKGLSVKAKRRRDTLIPKNPS